MRIGGRDFSGVAILVLDYDPLREEKQREAVTGMYRTLQRLLQEKYGGRDWATEAGGKSVIVLANEELVAEHQRDFEEMGLTFFPNWRESEEYGQLLREGLNQGNNIYLMRDIGKKQRGAAFGPAFTPKYALDRLSIKTLDSDLEIVNPDGRINLRPRH